MLISHHNLIILVVNTKCAIQPCMMLNAQCGRTMYNYVDV